MNRRPLAKKKRQRVTPKAPEPEISSDLIATVRERLAQNLSVRRALPGGGRLHIDRQLPFLCVYRQPSDFEDLGTQRLVKGEPSYLVSPSSPNLNKDVSKLVREVVKTLAAEFGAFLIVEIWAGEEGGKANDPASPSVPPSFTIHAPKADTILPTIEVFEKHLKQFKILKQRVEVTVEHDGRGHPPGMRPWLTRAESEELNCSFVGLTVPPVYRAPNAGKEFPLIARTLRRSLSLALRHTYFEFARSNTTHRPPHFHSLGRRAVVKAVWGIDGQLAEVSNQFDYLLQVTPVNAKSALKRFERQGFERPPVFHYPPLPVDPDLLKRQLYKIPIERVEDPALQQLFREKRNELDLKLTMLRDRDTPRFFYESLQLFGGVQDDLLQQAKALLKMQSGQASGTGGRKVSATAFAKRAETEFDYYRQGFAAFKAKARVTDEVNGLIVSRGQLLISPDLTLAPSRVEALLAHEVGTHLLTYYNGRIQPFQQLYTGLAGYEELQEGLAVLAEYLVGGLSSSRMRQLAARVVAVQALTERASFVDTFRMLTRDFGFSTHGAYSVVMRVYRGGGLTKDAVYLRGLGKVLRYVQAGGDLKPLFAGKLAAEHIPIIKELQYRKVLKPIPIVPRYMKDPTAIERLEQLRQSSASVVDLIGKPAAMK
ncbi:MAG: flavohemoglobin expression-modulating QEGLA motif protein [Polyangiales bacterium]